MFTQLSIFILFSCSNTKKWFTFGIWKSIFRQVLFLERVSICCISAIFLRYFKQKQEIFIYKTFTSHIICLQKQLQQRRYLLITEFQKCSAHFRCSLKCSFYINNNISAIFCSRKEKKISKGHKSRKNIFKCISKFLKGQYSTLFLMNDFFARRKRNRKFL